jgi:glycosyltransferase involved in cell wall biosynthesis
MKISVYIATFNGEAYISRHLKSILPQRGVNYEVILADDASLDCILDVVNAGVDHKSNPVNLSVAAIFNRALNLCLIRHFIFFDHSFNSYGLA